MTKEKYDNDVEMGHLLERFRVYFPTLNTVSASKCGVDVSSVERRAMLDH